MLDQNAVAGLLAQTEMFANLLPEHLQAVAKVTKIVAFPKNSVIVAQGTTSGELYIIAQGRVDVIAEDSSLGIEQVIGERTPPESFGEMSLLTEAPRSATVRASEDTVCAVLAKTSFDSVLRNIPAVAVELSRFLAKRLFQSSQLRGFRFLGSDELVYDKELYQTISDQVLRRHHAIPLFLRGQTLTIAMTRPHDVSAVAALRRETPGLGLDPVACSTEDYTAFVKRFLPPPAAPKADESEAPVQFHLENGDLVKVPFGTLLQVAYRAKGQKILLEGSSAEPALYLTGENGLVPLHSSFGLDAVTALQGQLKALFGDSSPLDDQRTRNVFLDGSRCEVKISRLNTLKGPRYAIGLTDPREAIPHPSLLWPSELVRTTVEDALTSGGGAVVVVGPTHSGRSTTLYSMMTMLESEQTRANIITLESEPLVGLDKVAQVRVEADFARQCDSRQLAVALKVALAQQPDTLVVDEPKSEDLARLLEAAEEGLTVLTTIRGDDPLTALAHLCSGKDQILTNLANLRLLVGQRLIRKICPQCRQEYSPSPAVLSQLEISGLGDRNDRYHQGTGCGHCRGTGSSGRVANFEILKFDGFLTEMLIGGRNVEALRKAAVSNGLLTSFKSTARQLVAHGQIAPTEALRLYGGSGKN